MHMSLFTRMTMATPGANEDDTDDFSIACTDSEGELSEMQCLYQETQEWMTVM